MEYFFEWVHTIAVWTITMLYFLFISFRYRKRKPFHFGYFLLLLLVPGCYVFSAMEYSFFNDTRDRYMLVLLAASILGAFFGIGNNYHQYKKIYYYIFGAVLSLYFVFNLLLIWLYMYDNNREELNYLSDDCILKVHYILPSYETHNIRIDTIVYRFGFIFERTLEREQYSLPSNQFDRGWTYSVHPKCEMFQKKYK